MTENQFKFDRDTVATNLKTPIVYDEERMSIGEVLDKLNELSDENKQLKQFKEDVFYKIDMHLQMLPTARDNEFNEENGDPGLYTGAIYMLETLKKELENE